MNTQNTIRNIWWIPLVTLSCFVHSCKKKTDSSFSNLLKTYVPSEVGFWAVYNVDSIRFSKNGAQPTVSDTIHFQIKEVIDSSYVDATGNEQFRIILYKRATSTDNWVLHRVWSSKVGATSYEKTEDDLRYIKLVFPPYKNQTWKGNAYINPNIDPSLFLTSSNETWTYEYTAVNESKTVGGILFDSTCTVSQYDYEQNIDKYFFQEVYANNVGLVYKESTNIHKQTASNPWTKPESGYIVRYTIADYKR